MTSTVPTKTNQENKQTKLAATKLNVNSDDKQQLSSTASLILEQHEDPIVNKFANVLSASARHHTSSDSPKNSDPTIIEKSTRPENIPDIASLFFNTHNQVHKDSAFDGLQTHEVRSIVRSPAILKAEHREELTEYENAKTELPNSFLEVAHTIGPYDSTHDFQSDQGDLFSPTKNQDDDTSTILPEAEPAYRYNIKVRSNGKVLDPPLK